jgi:hypothetical protein
MNRVPKYCRVGFALAALAPVLFTGCGFSTPTASASGAVTLNNKPLTGKVHLSFIGADNTPRVAVTDASGNFSLKDLPVGEVVVIVSEAREPEAAPAGGRKAEGERAAPQRQASRGQAPRAAVPAVYSDAGNPVLRYTLNGGDNSLAIQLRSAAK